MADLTPGRLNYSYVNNNAIGNDRALFDSWWRDLINRYGVCSWYYPMNYDPTDKHAIYGEVYEFDSPIPIMIMAEIGSESWLFSKFGLQTDSDFTAVAHIATWNETFGSAVSSEPKVGDVVRLDITGWSNAEAERQTDTGYASGDSICSVLNRNLSSLCEYAANVLLSAEDLTTGENANGLNLIPNITLTVCPSDGDWRRFPQLYQITERRYQDLGTGINMLGGHYVWLLRGKRFDYSYESGIGPENPADDNTPGGIVNDDDSIETISDEIFDYDDNPNTDDSVYGNF